MDEPTRLAALESRLYALERRNRRTHLRYGALLAILAALGLAAATVQDLPEVKAKKFVLVDEKGRTCAVLGTDDQKHPELAFYDTTGKKRLGLGVKNGDAFVVLYDLLERSRCGMSVDAGSQPHVLLQDEHQKPRLHLSLNYESAPNVLLFGKEGAIEAGFGFLADGKPWVKPEPGK